MKIIQIILYKYKTMADIWLKIKNNNLETPYLTPREKTEVLFFDGEKVENFSQFISILEQSFEDSENDNPAINFVNSYQDTNSLKSELKKELWNEEDTNDILLNTCLNDVKWGNYNINTLVLIHYFSQKLEKETPTEFLQSAYNKLLEEKNS